VWIMSYPRVFSVICMPVKMVTCALIGQFLSLSEVPMGLEAVPVAVVLQGQTNLTYLCESSEMTCETDDSVWPGREMYSTYTYICIFAYMCYNLTVQQGVSQEMVPQTE